MLTGEWILEKPDKNAVKALREAGFSRVLATLLALRGFSDKESAESFSECAGHAHNPLLMKDMQKAAERISAAVRGCEKITVYGDYDADGVTATALLYSYLKEAQADVSYYIPDRESEGYGLNADAVRKIAENGTDLIVTVDTGISAFEEAKLASELGMCLIITDHHEPRGEIPEVFAAVNPKRPDCEYPFRELAGVGVAFKLVGAIEKTENDDGDGETGLLGGLNARELFKKYGALVCLGTVADIVPLTGENRLFVSRGLKLVSEETNLGLSALLEAAGVSGRRVTSEILSFTAAPRINACGRISSADCALELLVTKDKERAGELAKQLDGFNRERREIETRIFKESADKINSDETLKNAPVTMVSGEGWHNGVIGIVASRLLELYGKPAIVVSFEGGVGRASCRSVPGFNIHKALVACSKYLERFGGHELAAGFSVKRENYDSLCSELMRLAKTAQTPPALKIKTDMRIKSGEITLSTARELRRLEPFGNGNPPPLFYIPAAQIISKSPVGNGHLRLTLNYEGFEFAAILFGAEKKGFDFNIYDVVDVAASLEVNVYKNSETLSVIIKNIRKSACFEYFGGLYGKFRAGAPVEPAALCAKLSPARGEFAAVYRLLRSKPGSLSLEAACRQIRLKDKNFNYFKMLLICDVFEETGLMEFKMEQGSDSMKFKINDGIKIELSSSELLRRLSLPQQRRFTTDKKS